MSGLRLSLARLGTRAALATLLGSALVIGGTEVGASASGLTNTQPNGLYNCNPYSSTITSSCLSGALSDFRAARAKEGLGPMVLPTGFTSLSVPNQIYVLTNIERRDRGLPTFLMGSSLTSIVLYAANNAIDPIFPSWTQQGGSNWASPKNSLWADFIWMYDDGIGSGNIDCTSSNQTGCWGHRRNILGSYGFPRVMGAALGATGVASIMMGYDSHDVPASVLPYAPSKIWARVLATHAISMSWPAPAYHGSAVLGYYVRYDSHGWGNTRLRQSWTTPTLSRGYHTVSVRAYNRYGSSSTRSLRVYVG